jgi:hypothetical protein
MHLLKSESGPFTAAFLETNVQGKVFLGCGALIISPQNAE